jgi:HD superfamily phosphohydrolase
LLLYVYQKRTVDASFLPCYRKASYVKQKIGGSVRRQKTNLVRDRIHEDFLIFQVPVLHEILNSAAVQRLKGISQLGIPDEFYFKKGFSRYEHSVGVMLLLKTLGASLEERLAGLLHDISHTPFSHLFEWALNGKGGNETHQDERHEEILLRSDAANILRKYGYDPVRIANLGNFSLLEQEIPELCADRIDYALREFPRQIVPGIIDALAVYDGKIVFKRKLEARIFGNHFLHCQLKSWGGFERNSRYFNFAQVLRKAVEIGLFSSFEEIAQNNEKDVIKKLKTSSDKDIKRILKRLKLRSLALFPRSTVPEFKKFRYVDPLYLESGRLLRLSETTPRFAEKLETAKADNSRGMYLAVL